MNKAMVAAGLVCVVAPAAAMLRADAPHAGADSGKIPVSNVLLADLLAGDDGAEEAQSPTEAGDGALPFRTQPSANNPKLAGLLLADVPSSSDFIDGFHPISLAAISDSLGGAGIGPARAGSQSNGGGWTTASAGTRGSGTFSAIAPSGGSRAGSSGAGGDGGIGEAAGGSIADWQTGVPVPNGTGSLGNSPAAGGRITGGLTTDGSTIGKGASTETLMVMPLPASVWMLLGAIAGLGVLSYRRGRVSS